MKYRMLTKEEMRIFDEDFKYFLIANGVSNEEWLKMNEEPEGEDFKKAERLVEIFSDTVLQKVYEKMRFIEFRSATSCMVFKLNEDNIELIALNSSSEKADLSTPESIHNALINQSDVLAAFKSKKNYSGNREKEIHKMISDGCVNSSEAFWIMLEKLVS